MQAMGKANAIHDVFWIEYKADKGDNIGAIATAKPVIGERGENASGTRQTRHRPGRVETMPWIALHRERDKMGTIRTKLAGPTGIGHL